MVVGVRPDRVAADEGREGTVVVALTDAQLREGLADVRWQVRAALRSGARTLVVDLAGVRQLPSAAAATLLWAHRTCRARGGAVLLARPTRWTRELLRRTGLWRVLPVVDARRGSRS